MRGNGWLGHCEMQGGWQTLFQARSSSSSVDPFIRAYQRRRRSLQQSALTAAVDPVRELCESVTELAYGNRLLRRGTDRSRAGG